MPADDAEVAADRLRAAGAWAIEERGVDPVELRTVLTDGRPTTLGTTLETTLERIGDLPAGWDVDVEEADETVSDAWRADARPIVVDERLTIRPAWVDGGPRTELEVVIEPGSAFGLGDHPTTRLSAAAVERLVRRGDRVLDVGCGTGVLSIVAALRGASHVEAVDVSAAAVAATLDNADRNGVASVVSASTLRLGEIDGRFDVVVANILAPELVALAADLRRLVGDGGRLVVSGVLADRHDHVVEALRPLDPVATTTMDGWAAVELARP